jgi:hypothetical protein
MWELDAHHMYGARCVATQVQTRALSVQGCVQQQLHRSRTAVVAGDAQPHVPVSPAASCSDPACCCMKDTMPGTEALHIYIQHTRRKALGTLCMHAAARVHI